MRSIKGTQTELNLLKSFAGESQVRNRYTYFAGVSRKEGYVQIAGIFEETANQEKEHAKRFFKFLEGGDLEIVAVYPGERSAQQPKTSWRPPRESMRSTHDFTPPLPPLPGRRVFLKLPRYGVSFRWLKSSMRNAIAICCPIWKPVRCSNVTKKWSGTAATAAICIQAKKRPALVRPAFIRRRTSNCWEKTGKTF